MPLAPYTTPSLIRSALGVSAQDLRDDKIDISTHRTCIREGLYSISPTLPDDLVATLELASPTPQETRLRDLGEMVCTYLAAHLLCTSAPLFAPRTVKDDRTTMERVDDPFKDLRKNLADTLAYITAKLKAAYLEVYPGAVVGGGYAQPRTVMSVGLGVDPVTG